MRRRFGVVLVLLAAGLVAVWMAACSASDDNGGAGGAGATGTGTGGSGADGASTGTAGSGGDIGLGGQGIGGACETICSADLKKVIDCHGAVVQECTGDQACLNGQCDDDPCGAAEASQSSYGCNFWTFKPDMISAGNGACFAAYVANTWSVPVHLSVEYQGQPIQNAEFIQIPQGQGTTLTYTPYDPNAGLPVGEVAVIFLTHQPGASMLPVCPFAAASSTDVAPLGTGMGDAFEIIADRPVVAYSILPYGGGSAAATSATLLLPTSAWDTNYVAVNAYPKSQIVADGQPSLNIVAYQDSTEVTILPKVNIVGGGGVAAGTANQPVVYQLDRGQYLQISQVEELTGSPIQSNNPVGLWGASSCLNVPVSQPYCDSAHQQIPPVQALGSRYAGVRYRNRTAAAAEETPPWRVVGAVDGTQLTWTPSLPAGAPAAVNLGEVFEFNAAGPFVVESQDADHPFYIAQYMTGGGQFNPGEGDPEWVNVIPVDQYLDSYVFFTDPTYPETSLVVVRRKSMVTDDFVDVTLDCAGVLTGWQPLGDYEYTRLDLVTGDFVDVGGCSNGRHVMQSDAAFGVTVWGWGGYSGIFSEHVSYAYPAGASVQPINEVVIPPVPR